MIGLRGNKLQLEKHHAWIRQDPGSDPPVPKHSSLDDSLRRFGNLNSVGFAAGMEAEDVSFVEINIHGEKSRKLQVPPEDSAWMLDSLLASRPFVHDCEPLAKVTHQVAIHYRSQPAVSFTIFADSLAISDHGVAFRTEADFSSKLLKRAGFMV